MTRSNKPVIWLPFAIGGTIAAFIMPAIMLVLLLASLELFPENAFSYERLLAFAGHPFIAFCLFFLLGFPLWHAAHRLRMTVQDLGVRGAVGRSVLARFCYLSATAATLLLLYSLLHG